MRHWNVTEALHGRRVCDVSNRDRLSVCTSVTPVDVHGNNVAGDDWAPSSGSRPGSNRRATDSDWRRESDYHLVIRAARALTGTALHSGWPIERQVNIKRCRNRRALFVKPRRRVGAPVARPRY